MDEENVKKSSRETNPNAGHRQRLRERYLKEGLDNFQPHEVIEMLLHYAIPRKDTKEIAKQLNKSLGGVSGVFDSSAEEIMKVAGVGENSAILLSMLGPLFRYYTKEQAMKNPVSGPQEIERYLVNRLCGYEKEMVVLACIDNRYGLVTDVIIGEGSVNESVIDKRKAVEMVLKYNATAAVIAHNHPAGFALPSRADIQSTIELKNAFDAIGVRLLDHIITCPDDHVSMAQSRQFAYIFE